MVWFQCEDCGENLKKPKLPNHFRMCSATKLSCIDCGEMFGQQSVQTHTQCITEAEKYGPKGQAKSPHGAQQKPNKPKQGPDVDVNVGLSSRPPWKCSLCNTATTSQQTLQFHAEGKKHRAKARAFHAAQNPSTQTEELIPSNGNAKEDTKIEANGTQSSEAQEAEETGKDCSVTKAELEVENGVVKKRKQDALTPADATNGEVTQADKKKEDSQRHPKKKKNMDEKLAKNDEYVDNKSHGDESPRKNIKWKKIVSSILKSQGSDGAMKIKKLQKLAIKVVRDTGINNDEIQLCDELLKKISSSSQFVMEDKYVRLAAKGASS